MRKVYVPKRSAPVLPALAVGALIAGSFIVGIFLPFYSAAPTWQIVAETRSGDVYIAGAGSTCRDASRNAVIPQDWTRITCERSRFSAR